MQIARDPDARIIPTGAPIETDDVVFEGSVDGVRSYLREMSAEERAGVSIWTPGHVFTVDEFEAERPGGERDPLPMDGKIEI